MPDREFDGWLARTITEEQRHLKVYKTWLIALIIVVVIVTILVALYLRLGPQPVQESLWLSVLVEIGFVSLIAIAGLCGLVVSTSGQLKHDKSQLASIRGETPQ